MTTIAKNSEVRVTHLVPSHEHSGGGVTAAAGQLCAALQQFHGINVLLDAPKEGRMLLGSEVGQLGATCSGFRSQCSSRARPLAGSRTGRRAGVGTPWPAGGRFPTRDARSLGAAQPGMEETDRLAPLRKEAFRARDRDPCALQSGRRGHPDGGNQEPDCRYSQRRRAAINRGDRPSGLGRGLRRLCESAAVLRPAPPEEGGGRIDQSMVCAAGGNHCHGLASGHRRLG